MTEPELGYIVTRIRSREDSSGREYFSFTVELPELNLVFASKDQERILGLHY